LTDRLTDQASVFGCQASEKEVEVNKRRYRQDSPGHQHRSHDLLNRLDMLNWNVSEGFDDARHGVLVWLESQERALSLEPVPI
jgi:hypothetical protein